ncbi:MAG: PilZ domain-containing protein [Oscillospiraceae bacterium]|nr:PilZ domain-containing protein [Oscillospiraceae bacterium]
MLNNRRFVRCSYSYDAALSSNEVDWKEIVVENVSAGGLNFLIKTAKFKVDDELSFKLEIAPHGQERVEYETVAKGRIVRVVPTDDQFEFGVEFFEKDMSTLAPVIKFLMA